MNHGDDSPLTPEMVMSLQTSQGILRSLMYDIRNTMEVDAGFDMDRGANNLLDIVVELLYHMRAPSQKDAADTPMPAPVVQVFAEYIVPGLATVTTQLQEVWTDISAAVNNGGNGAEVIDAWLEIAEVPGQGALAQVEQGREELRSLIAPVIIMVIEEALDLAEDAEVAQRESAVMQADLDRELKKILDQNDQQNGHSDTDSQ